MSPTLRKAHIRAALCELGYYVSLLPWVWPAWVVRERPWDWAIDG